jgi:hypothetical protein
VNRQENVHPQDSQLDQSQRVFFVRCFHQNGCELKWFFDNDRA